MAILSGVFSPILIKLIDKTWDAAEDEIKAIKNVHKSIKSLSTTLKSLEQYFNEAEKVEHGINKKDVDFWVEDLREKAFDAEDILDLFATRSDRLKWKKDHENKYYSILNFPKDGVSGIWFKKETADAIKNLSDELFEIHKKRDDFLKLKNDYAESSGGNQKMLSKKETGPSVDASAIVGREDEKNTLINDLTSTNHDQSSEKFHVVPILGNGGVGKTTLAQLVYNDTKIKDHFGLRIWISATNDFNLDRILREIIQSVSEFRHVDLTSCNLSGLQTSASDILSDKRFLLVIDDVCTMNPNDWGSLKGIFQTGENGSRVLVTSREEDRIKMMMPKYKKLEPLGELNNADSLKLFWKSASMVVGVGGVIDKEFERIGNKIIENCKGLPLAITAIGHTLRGKDNIKRWKEMANYDFCKIEEKCLDKNREILPVLKVSFDQLPSHLKPCFLLCSLFPKGHSLVKNELVKIWIAHGYIPFDDKPEELGDAYFDELCKRPFFHRSNVEGYDVYTMHDLFHQLALFISGGSFLQLTNPSLIPTVKNKIRHISLQCEKIEKPTLEVISKEQTEKVRTILMPGDNLRNFANTLLEDLFGSLKYVRVLDLSSSSIDELPDLFNELHLLRYLDLSNTGISILPKSICDLWNLQTLRLLLCRKLKELPKELSKLVSLRHLELDDTFWLSLSQLPPGAGNLKNLQNLTKFWVRREKGYGINELRNLDCLTGKLHLLGLENVHNNARKANLYRKENLNHLVFEWSRREQGHPPIDNDTNTLSGLQPHSNIENLQIINFGGGEFPAWISNGLLKNLTTLSLNHCTHCRILSLWDLELLALKHIYLINMPELEKWISGKENRPMLSLQTIQIIRCPKLRILPDEFENLQTLEIKECGSLKDLPAIPSILFITLISNDTLENWNEKIPITSSPVVQIQSCPKLKPFPDQVREQLRDLPPVTDHKPLQHLTLSGSLLNLGSHSNSLLTLALSNISQLIDLNDLSPCLPRLKALYINGCNDLQHLWKGDGDLHNQITPALTYLSIKNCKNLIDLSQSGLPAELEGLVIGSCTGLENLGSAVTFRGLISLKNINIENCHSLKSLPVQGFPSSLKHLKIVNCPQLKEVISNMVVVPDRMIEFVNRTNIHNPTPPSEPEPALEPEMESGTVVTLAGNESSKINCFQCLKCCKCLKKWCCLM